MTGDLARMTGWVESEGERIYWEATGSGQPVVLCHGLGGNHAIWWQQVEPFAAEHRLLSWDQRGFGNSSCYGGDLGTPAARRDLRAVLDHLELESVDLVGQSMGGWVALGFALAHPDRVRRLVLSTTLAGAERVHVERLVAAEPARDRLNRRQHPVLSPTFCARTPDLAVLYNLISSFGGRPSPGHVLQGLADDRFPVEALADLAVPTLVLAADADELCPPTAMKPLADLVRNGEFVALPGSHSLYYEDPAAWNAAVLAFLRR